MGNNCVCLHTKTSNEEITSVIKSKIETENTKIEIITPENKDQIKDKNSDSISTISNIEEEYDMNLHDENIFNFINEIRMNPNDYIEILSKIIDNIKILNGKLHVNKNLSAYINSYVLSNENSSNDDYILKTNSTKDELKLNIEILKKEVMNTFNEPIIWDDKVIQFAMNRTNACLMPTDRKSASMTSSSYFPIDYEFYGHLDPHMTVYCLLLEMSVKDAISMLTESFDFSGIYSQTSSNTFVTLILFGKKKYNKNN